MLETIEKTTRRTELKVEALKAKQAQLYNRMLSVVRSVEVRVCCGLCFVGACVVAVGVVVVTPLWATSAAGSPASRSLFIYPFSFVRVRCVVLGAALPGRSVAGHGKEVRG